MRERENIIDNPVYSEILIKINKDKVYASELIKKFKNKERSVLTRQLNILEKKGYLKRVDISQKIKGNIKYYIINKERIVKDFYNILVQFAYEKKKVFDEGYSTPIKNIKEWRSKYILKHNNEFFIAVDKQYNSILNKKFKDNFIKNSIIQYFIIFFLEEVNLRYNINIRFKNVTLREIFLLIFEMGLYSYLTELEGNLKENSVNKQDISFISELTDTLKDMGLGSGEYNVIGRNSSDKTRKKFSK